MPTVEGHVFISYVHEDKARVDRLQTILEAAGIRVWRDTQDLWPGEDWKQRIHDAISNGALAFLACFSEHSAARPKNYQNAELALAADEIRLRPPGTPWLIPVRFDAVGLPDYDLGGGRSLHNLQRVDVIGEEWAAPCARLVTSILRILAAGLVHPGSANPGTSETASVSTASKIVPTGDVIQATNKPQSPTSIQALGPTWSPSTSAATPAIQRLASPPSPSLQSRQLKALAIDGGIAMAVAQLTVVLQVLLGATANDANNYLVLAFGVAYAGIGTLSHRLLGATIGQQRAKLEVVDSNGRPITSTTAFLRAFTLHFDGVGTSRTRCNEAKRELQT